MRLHVHHHFEGRCEIMRRLDALDDKTDLVLKNQEYLMIDTSKILASVTAAKTKIDSLIALANGQSATMKDLSAQLAAAIAANDPKAMAQVQADLDTASTDLDTETAAVTKAIDANTPLAPPPPAT